MFGADFEYWLNQDIEEVPDKDSISVLLDRVQNFRNEKIKEKYSSLTYESLGLDPQGEFSTTDEPTLRLDLTEESPLRNSWEDDAENLHDDNGAVLHSYNLGRGIIAGIEETIEELPEFETLHLEILDKGEPVIYNEDLTEGSLRYIKETVQHMDSQTSYPMAMGLLAAYIEDR